MNLIAAVFFVELFTERFVLDDAVEGLADCFGLLLDQLNGVSQEDNFLLLGVGEVVVHGGNGNARLAQAGGEVDDGIAVLALLE